MPLPIRSEEHTSELQSHDNLVCRLLLEKKKNSPLHRSPRHTKSHTTTTKGSSRTNTICKRIVVGAFPSLMLKSPANPAGIFFFNDTAPTEIFTLSLPDSFPI